MFSLILLFFFFFFSSRRRHTRCLSDWSSDVCSSDLIFPTVAHAAAWAGVCPSNNESAGKRMGQQKRRGNVHLATALLQAAMAASKTKDTYLKARFWKIAGRAGKKRAAVAVAHSILNAIYQMLKGSVDYTDLGGNYL